MNRSDSLEVRASAAEAGGRGFDPWPSHTEDFLKKWYIQLPHLAVSIKRRWKKVAVCQFRHQGDMDFSERCRLRLGSEMDHSIPVSSITPGKWTPMEPPTGSLQRKDQCPISMSSLDEDSGLGMDIDQENFLTSNQLDLSLHDAEEMDVPKTEFQSRRPSARFNSLYIRCLFKNKRSLYQDENVSSTPKRFRDESLSPMPSSWTISTNLAPCPDATCVIIDAVDRMTIESDLIADGSRTYSLPTVPSNHTDLKCISTQTMAAVLRGEFAGIDKRCTIIDCRYPYEFQAGHIKGAVNLYAKEAMQQFLHRTFDESYSTQRRIIIFYCEFSSVRGPKMYRFLREQDRILNKDKYPHLCYPEVYLLEGGYKAFYEDHKHYCEPMDYKPMSHKDHGVELRHFKTKPKSSPAAHRRHDHLCHKLVF